MVKLTVKTIKGKKFQIEVEQTQTVRCAPLEPQERSIYE